MSVTAHHLHPATGPHELFAHARRYLGAISHRVGRRYKLDPDELFNEMAALLLANAGAYDPARGRPEAFAALWLRPALARLRPTRSVPTEQAGPDDDRVGPAAGAGPEPADLAADGEQVARLREAVGGLPDRERQAVTLRFGLGDTEGLSWDAVGERLGVHGATARALVARAMDHLRAVLGDGPGE
ncbi:MAG: sigma-70 family RNA polymerase sigma factor [Gemmataceae bacterium]